jgi:hypothetical protein
MADTNAGLMGPIIITRAGSAVSPSNPKPKDVDKEFVFFLSVIDEGSSALLDVNLAKLLPTLSHSQIDVSDTVFFLTGRFRSNSPILPKICHKYLKL